MKPRIKRQTEKCKQQKTCRKTYKTLKNTTQRDKHTVPPAFQFSSLHLFSWEGSQASNICHLLKLLYCYLLGGFRLRKCDFSLLQKIGKVDVSMFLCLDVPLCTRRLVDFGCLGVVVFLMRRRVDVFLNFLGVALPNLTDIRCTTSEILCSTCKSCFGKKKNSPASRAYFSSWCGCRCWHTDNEPDNIRLRLSIAHWLNLCAADVLLLAHQHVDLSWPLA